MQWDIFPIFFGMATGLKRTHVCPMYLSDIYVYVYDNRVASHIKMSMYPQII